VRRSARLLLLGLLPAALAACGGGGGGGTTAATTTAPAQVHQRKSLTLHVTSVVTSTKAHSRTPKQTTAGDRVVFTDRLLNATSGQFGKDTNAVVGTDEGTMTFTSKTTARLDGVAHLPDGDIRFSGAVTVLADKSVTVPVVGGTGTYKHATGTLLVGAGTKTSPNTYRLVIDGIPGPVA
jgi:hypothetical protein